MRPASTGAVRDPSRAARSSASLKIFPESEWMNPGRVLNGMVLPGTTRSMLSPLLISPALRKNAAMASLSPWAMAPSRARVMVPATCRSEVSRRATVSLRCQDRVVRNRAPKTTRETPMSRHRVLRPSDF